jgi:hypothetical protein
MAKMKSKLKRYNDKKETKFFDYKIIVPTEKDRKQLIEVFRYLHNLRCIDTDYILVNQLVHEYEHDSEPEYSSIIVNKELFEQI